MDGFRVDRMQVAKGGGGPGGGHWQQHTMVKTVEGDGWSKILALSSSIRLVICH